MNASALRTSSDGTLAQMRGEIERVDAAIVALVAERVRLARGIGRVKREAGLAVTDPAREAEVVARAATLGRDAGVSEEDVRAMYWQLLAMSRRAQQG